MFPRIVSVGIRRLRLTIGRLTIAFLIIRVVGIRVVGILRVLLVRCRIIGTTTGLFRLLFVVQVGFGILGTAIRWIARLIIRFVEMRLRRIIIGLGSLIAALIRQSRTFLISIRRFLSYGVG